MCSKHYPALGVLTGLGASPTPLVSPDPCWWIAQLPRKSLITRLTPGFFFTPCFITQFMLGSSSPTAAPLRLHGAGGLQGGTPGSVHHCGCSRGVITELTELTPVLPSCSDCCPFTSCRKHSAAFCLLPLCFSPCCAGIHRWHRDWDRDWD